MSWILIAAIFLAIAAIILMSLSKRGVAESADYPYQSFDTLFSPAERSFYGVLRQVVGNNANIFGKVRVADVVMPRKGLSRSDRQKAFNKISGKHFDFVLCNNSDLSVICAIELDDRSHRSKKRQQRDEFLVTVCKGADVPLIQIRASSSYVIDDVKQLIAPYMNFNEPRSTNDEKAKLKSVTGKKICPKCSSKMVIRVAKKGRNLGKKFWACGAYPKCKYIEAISA